MKVAESTFGIKHYGITAIANNHNIQQAHLL